MLNLSNVLYDIQNNTTIATGVSKEEQLLIFTEMKKFLLSHCRKGSKAYKTIYYADPYHMNDYGIFKRMNYENGRAFYIACQDFTEEIKTLKKCFK